MSLSRPESSFEVKLPAKYDLLSTPQRRAARQQYIALQNEECWFCGGTLLEDTPDDIRELPIDWSLFPGEEDFIKHPVHLQHDHSTGLTEGAVHSFCNAFMWNYYRR